MGLFKCFNKKSDSPGLHKKLFAHLDEVDEVYMRAYATRSLKQLRGFVSHECADKVGRVVFSQGINSRYFGAPKFRKTVWSVIEQRDNVLKVLKDVTFDSVRVGSILSVGVARDYKEYWTVQVSDDGFNVTDISAA